MNCGIGGNRMPTSSSSSTLSSIASSMVGVGTGIPSSTIVSTLGNRPNSCYGDKLPIPPAPSNMGPHRDDGSSGYGSPDSETFESPQAQ